MNRDINLLFGVVLGVAALFGLMLVIPEQENVALIVTMLCAGVGLLGTLLVRSPHERRIVRNIFLFAFFLRIGFALVAYRIGIAEALAGGDEVGWKIGWRISREWQAEMFNGRWSLSNEIINLFANLRGNRGYYFMAACFYTLIDVRSQLALACFNCFASALTVVVIYKMTREFFSEQTSLFTAKIAMFMPGFLAWSILTIKETWLILFEISTLFVVWRLWRTKNLLYALAAILLILVTHTFRFYVAWICIAALVISLMCSGSKRPAYTLVGAVCLVMVGGWLLNSLGIVRFDLASIADSRLAELDHFRNGLFTISDAATTGVKLDYDIRTPGGAVMMILTGAAYVLLSPFPWQMFSGRQIYALPDVIMWWTLVFGFIVQGLAYSWRQKQALFVSLLAFSLPLILFYSLIFGNVGLAYRQRAQIMPFLLIFAAAGYEARRVRSNTRRLREENQRQRVLLPAILSSVLAAPPSETPLSTERRSIS